MDKKKKKKKWIKKMAAQFKSLISLLINKMLKGKLGIYKKKKREIRTKIDNAQTRNCSY